MTRLNSQAPHGEAHEPSSNKQNKRRLKTVDVVPTLDAAIDGYFRCIACGQVHAIAVTAAMAEAMTEAVAEQKLTGGGTSKRGKRWRRIWFHCPVEPASDAYALLVPIQRTAEEIAKGEQFALDHQIGRQWAYLLV